MAKFGLNTKGTLGIPILPSFSAWLQNQKLDEIWLRVQGGTISQKEYESDWQDGHIQAWADLYAANPTVKLVFVANLNDTAENSLKLYNRFLAKGCKFEFIELGNEQYLSKYRLSKDLPEVTLKTREMSPEKYLALCQEFLPKFNGSTIVVQLAPNKNKNIDEYYNHWNRTILNATNQIPEINYSMHIYANAGFRWELVEEVQEVIKSKFLAVTEFGAADAADGEQDNLTEEQFIAMTQVVAERLSEELREQDIVFDQVLWNPWSVPSISFEDGDLTAKGRAVFDAFNEPFEEPEIPEVLEPVLVGVIPNNKGQWVMWGRQTLIFSNEQRFKVRVRFETWPFSSDDYGKTINELKEIR